MGEGEETERKEEKKRKKALGIHNPLNHSFLYFIISNLSY